MTERKQPREKGNQLDKFSFSPLFSAQAQTLHSARDYLHFTPHSEETACADILDELPAPPWATAMACEFHEAPELLRREARSLFPHRDLSATRPLSVLTLAQRARNDMSTWSDDVEDEREKLAGQFVGAAKEICARLKSEGFWADFIDPCSGAPFFGPPPANGATMFETDEKYRLLGFRIEDLGCCKVRRIATDLLSKATSILR